MPRAVGNMEISTCLLWKVHVQTLTTPAEFNLLNQCSEDSSFTPALDGRHTSLLSNLVFLFKYLHAFIYVTCKCSLLVATFTIQVHTFILGHILDRTIRNKVFKNASQGICALWWQKSVGSQP